MRARDLSPDRDVRSAQLVETLWRLHPEADRAVIEAAQPRVEVWAGALLCAVYAPADLPHVRALHLALDAGELLTLPLQAR